MPQAQQTNGSKEFLPKTFYFFYYAAMASLFPFLALHYEQIGLDKQQIGLLASIPPILVLLGGSLWGAAADATRKHKLTLAVAIVGAILFSRLLSTTVHFLWLIPVVLAFALFQSPIVPLADNSVMEILGERKDRYGKIRLWGAVGWGAAAPLIGRIVEQFGLGWSFHGYALLMFCCLLVTLRLPVAHASIGSPFRSGLKTLLADRRWLLFLFLVLAGGVGMSFVQVRKLTVRNVTMHNNESFAIRVGEVDRFLIENVLLNHTVIRPNQDGIHVGGFSENGVIRNISAKGAGVPNDDMVALNADD